MGFGPDINAIMMKTIRYLNRTRSIATRNMPRVNKHNEEIYKNKESCEEKIVLRQIYEGFYRLIKVYIPNQFPERIVEIGSGASDISRTIPNCIRTDLFPNPWIDQTENAYDLSFQDGSLTALILFDVFHHLRYPGTALKEFKRVLGSGGRVIIFEPCVSLLGFFVYGMLHHEPLAPRKKIDWEAPADWSPEDIDYYAAQSNATRIFLKNEIEIAPSGWRIVDVIRLSAVSYVASGGYSKKQFYPDRALPLMRWLDKICDALPAVFATRLLVVLETVD